MRDFIIMCGHNFIMLCSCQPATLSQCMAATCSLCMAATLSLCFAATSSLCMVYLKVPLILKIDFPSKLISCLCWLSFVDYISRHPLKQDFQY